MGNRWTAHGRSGVMRKRRRVCHGALSVRTPGPPASTPGSRRRARRDKIAESISATCVVTCVRGRKPRLARRGDVSGCGLACPMVSVSSPISEFVTVLLDLSSSRSSVLLTPDARRLEKLRDEFSRKLWCLCEVGVASLGPDDASPSLLALQPISTHLPAAKLSRATACSVRYHVCSVKT